MTRPRKRLTARERADRAASDIFLRAGDGPSIRLIIARAIQNHARAAIARERARRGRGR